MRTCFCIPHREKSGTLGQIKVESTKCRESFPRESWHQYFILIFPIVKWRNHCNFTLSNKSFHVFIGEIQVFLDSRTPILKKSLVYVSPAFTHLLYSPNANILEIIDFTPTLHNTQNLSAISVFICHRLSLISRTFHCHNCSQNTGNEAS